MVTITIGIGIDQGREPLQETIEWIEALAMIGLDQGPELVPIGTGYDAMHVENRTILQEIVPTLERKETWISYNTC